MSVETTTEKVEMSKVQLKPGDYVSTEGMTEEQYHAVARSFMEAGADSGSWEHQMRLDFLGWRKGSWRLGLLFQSGEGVYRNFNRHLAIEQVIG